MSCLLAFSTTVIYRYAKASDFHLSESELPFDFVLKLWRSGSDDSEGFLRAAEQGHVNAQATLGAYYWEGRGVPQDLSKAYLWSAIALTEGDMNSKSRLEGLASQMTQEQVSDTLQQAEVWIRTHSQRAKSKAN